MEYVMRDLRPQVRSALRSYFERGKLLADAMKDADPDALKDLVLKRRAAFYNFKAALDHAERFNDYDIQQDESCAQLLNDVLKQTESLESLLSAECGRAKSSINKVQQGRQRISRYRTRDSLPSGFVQTA